MKSVTTMMFSFTAFRAGFGTEKQSQAQRISLPFGPAMEKFPVNIIITL